jgi:hypothetical protein
MRSRLKNGKSPAQGLPNKTARPELVPIGTTKSLLITLQYLLYTKLRKVFQAASLRKRLAIAIGQQTIKNEHLRFPTPEYNRPS